ncbi:Plus3 domain-containing protein [Abeliophyllum distichum]|uniref:Plus3 domain-containing protein n=1 Tax=Abeliophyllum distichum TaxID=126358 RepID=A0ABD1VZK9_9LAMI
MSSSSTGGDAMRRVGGEASPSVSPCLEGVLPIRGVDGSTGEAIPINVTPSLRRDDNPYRADVVRWTAMDVPLIMVEEDLTKLREAYRIPEDIELILLGPNEQACFLRRGCTALHLNAFVSGMRLPLHPMLRRILRAYDLALTQVAPNGWSQMVGGMYLWFQHSFSMEMPLHVFQTIYQPRKLPRKKGREEEIGWYYFCPWGSHKPLVTGCPSSIKQWKESWFWVSDPLPRCKLSEDIVDVLRSIYQADQKSRSYGLILNRHRCLVELGLMASKAEMDQGRRPRPTLARLTQQRQKTLVPGSAKVTSQRKAIEDLSRVGNETLAVNTLGEVVLEGPSKSTQTLEGRNGRPYDSKRWFRELIGTPDARIPDDALRNLPFYPSMGAQAVKKYFTPKWDEFSSHGELEDVLEASLASSIRASAMQMKCWVSLGRVCKNKENLLPKFRRLIRSTSKPWRDYRLP